MQRLYILYSLVVLAALLAACIPSFSTTQVGSEQETAVPQESTSSLIDSANPYLKCLSSAFQMNVERAAHTATLLPDGNVLIAGGFREDGTSEVAIASAELFDPVHNTFSLIRDLNEPRNGHTSTLLESGQVLITGGWDQDSRTSTAELYDPQTGTFVYTGSLMAPRQGFTATLLKDGKVLIAGGDSARNTLQLTAELYDPAAKSFAPAGILNNGRMGHTATLLPDGKVLLVGGTSSNDEVLASAEIYDPDTGTFTFTNDANSVRYKHAAVLLKDGNVLILGGSNAQDWTGKYDSAELYDVRANTFTKIQDMNHERFKLADAAVLLADGNVLIGGGNRQIEIFDAQNQEFISGGTLDDDYYFSVLTPLSNGQVLISGGYNGNILPSAKAWLYCG